MDVLVECILTQDHGSTHESTPRVTRKENKEAGVTEEEHLTQQSVKKVKNRGKKKKRTHDSQTNGILNGHHEEGDENCNNSPEVRLS